MSLDSDISLLNRIPLFSELTTEQLRLLAFSAVRLDLAADQILFREDAKAMSGFIVVSGGLELSVGHDDRKHVVATCETGCLVGELALFVETRRPATGTAMVATQVLEIDRKLIIRMLNEYPNVAQRLHATLSERLSATVADLGRVRQALIAVDDQPAARR
jgi:CRP-like cAMP-binding protein